MSVKKFPSEINEHTVKLIVGLIALSLASIELVLTHGRAESISASYYFSGWPQTIFIGFLFAIGALMFSYNGKAPWQKTEMTLSKTGAVAAVCIAMFPCNPPESIPHPDNFIPYIHYIAAGILFVILAIFCGFFFYRSWKKGHAAARSRAMVYLLCGLAIVTSILILIFGRSLSSSINNFTLIFENTGLFSFGIAWLLAGSQHFVPGKYDTAR